MLVLTLTLTLPTLALQRNSPTEERRVLVATFETLALIAQEICGDKVEVVALLPPGVEPHEYQLSPQQVKLASSALLILHTGHCSFEEKLLKLTGVPSVGLRDFLRAGLTLLPLPSRSPEVRPSAQYTALELASAGYNIHGWWLDPGNAAVIAKVLTEKLCEVDPENSRYYRQSLQYFLREVKLLQQFLQHIRNRVRGVKVVLLSPAPQYLVEALGLRPVAVLSLGTVLAGGRTVAEVLHLLRSGEAKLIIAPHFAKYSKLGEYAESLSKETGVPVVYVYVVENPGCTTYTQLLTYDIALILAGLEQSEVRPQTPATTVPATVLTLLVAGVLTLATGLVLSVLAWRRWGRG